MMSCIIDASTVMMSCIIDASTVMSCIIDASTVMMSCIIDASTVMMSCIIDASTVMIHSIICLPVKRLTHCWIQFVNNPRKQTTVKSLSNSVSSVHCLFNSVVTRYLVTFM